MILLHMAAGLWVSHALSVAAKLGIADLLEAGPESCGRLAEITHTDPRALYRVLRALASIGVFAENADRRFSLTPIAECLLAKSPNSLRAFVIMLGEEEHWRTWGDVLYSVRTGQPAFDHVFGASRFAHLAEHPEDARIFGEAMTSRGAYENAAIVSSYDFSGSRTVVDVGGGQGSLLADILKANISARGVLFDLPHATESARTAMIGAAQAARCEFRAGDFFAAAPAGADTYILKKVIHDWDDERATAILTNCREAMARAGRLLVIEPIIPTGNLPSFNKLLDLLLLVWTPGGRGRTEQEASGTFSLPRILKSRA